MAFVSASVNTAATSSVTVTAPATIQDGDILVAFFVGYKSSGGAAAMTPPLGFAVWTNRVTTNYRSQMLWKRAASESGDYAFSCTSGTGEISAGICVYRGRLATGDPLGVYSDTAYVANDNICRAAGMIVGTLGSDVVWAGFDYAATLTLAVPSGMNSRTFKAQATCHCQAIGDLLNQSTGATGDRDGTMGSAYAGNKHAYMVEIKPALPTTAFVPGIMQTQFIPSFGPMRGGM
jgi:hypothetical protein